MDETVNKTDLEFASRSTRSEIEEQSRRLALTSGMLPILSMLPDAIIILNGNMETVFANVAASKFLKSNEVGSVLGLRPGELLDCKHAFECVGGCGTSRFCGSCGERNAVLATHRSVPDMQECQVIQSHSGNALDLRVWAFPFEVDASQFSIVVLRDISDEKRRRALERIFFHDIVNTVSGITTLSDLLVETVGDPKMGSWNADVVTKLSKMSNRLIDEIDGQMELAAAEHGDLVMHVQHAKSLSFLRGLADQYAQFGIATGKRIVIDSFAEDVAMKTDSRLLGRVLGNMIKNALEAAQKGDTVTLSCQKDADCIRFSVHNPGFIPPENQLSIFKRSFSTKESGRGLGTHSMRLLSERYLRGSVAFTTSEQRGTMFVARYPVDISRG